MARKQKIEKPLTELELQLMNAVWMLGPCTVKEVQTEISKSRKLAYTSIATIMKILETKGILKSIKNDKAHTYSPKITKEVYEALALEHMAANLFLGMPSKMVMCLLNDSNLSQKDLEDIKKVVDAKVCS